MSSTDQNGKIRDLGRAIADTGNRIRRYTMDGRLQPPSLAVLQQSWDDWLKVWKAYDEQSAEPVMSGAQVRAIRMDLMPIDRRVDLVQREIVSDKSFLAGVRTMTWLSALLVALALFYLASHGVRGMDFSEFAPLAEWGPLKYVEVAFWSTFGVLCWLLFLAANFTSRRDFDPWYQPWYLATLLRAPFLTIILMMIVLEFTEWYGQGTWIETYILEEGNKFYFICFVSFCLGMMSDESSAIMRDLSTGVVEFVGGVVQAVVKKLNSVFSRGVTDK